jgi:pyruvate carboxylase subunit B
MLTDAGFSLPDVQMDAYMEARRLSQSFIDAFLGYYIDPENRYLNSILIGSGLPGGMMGSLMADLQQNLASLNKWMVKHDKNPVTKDDLLLKLFKEVEYVWPRIGYPPLVTPYSQYVKNVALMNVIQMYKGQQRWSMIDENTWSMILGKAGKLPGPVGDEIRELAKSQDREFFEGNAQDLYEDELDGYRAKMAEKNWDPGTDEEELFEYAMHPQQYEELKSGKAKSALEADIAKHQKPAVQPATHEHPAEKSPKSMVVDVNGEKFRVHVSYNGVGGEAEQSAKPATVQSVNPAYKNGSSAITITSPLEGKFYLTKDNSERAIAVGDVVQKGDTVAYIESMKVINAITSDKEGKVIEILPQHGTSVDEDDVIIRLSSLS